MTSEIHLDDSMVLIKHNPNLKHKPFLLEIYTFDSEPYSIRFSESDLKLLAGFINKVGENNGRLI
jgi:hypothetical protein